MITAIPVRIREKLGEEVAEDIFRFMEDISEEKLSKKAVSKEEFGFKWEAFTTRSDGVDRRFDKLEPRFDELERRMDKLEHRFGDLEHRFDGLEQSFKELADTMKQDYKDMTDRMDRIYDQMGSQLRWTVGTISLFGTLMLIAMAVFKFVQ